MFNGGFSGGLRRLLGNNLIVEEEEPVDEGNDNLEITESNKCEIDSYEFTNFQIEEQSNNVNVEKNTESIYSSYDSSILMNG